MAETKEAYSLGDRIDNFIQNKRRGILICAGALVVLLAAFVGAAAIRDKLRENAIREVENFAGRYDELRFTIADDTEAAAALLEELSAFAPKASGYPGARAYALIAGIRGDKKEWAEAEQAWREAAKKAGRSYLAPVALFNAAAAAEEQGKTAEAIALYGECISESFPSSPRAQFAIGRLEEKLGNRENALAAYQALRTNWPADTLWRNLAQSRIISLEGEKR
ncbi:MAG: tetratricopeptide repeat protein [Treponema sp.]|jgi:tetratricopeptide (TPR) repeat protein|nr:tetratricopeptide repeat protein [Treponema sp.]